MAIGQVLVIGSACVANNILDKDLDAQMERTRQRALVSGQISIRGAVIESAVLGIAGLLTLYFYTNFLTAYLVAVGWIGYVLVYGIAKRQSEYGTLVGSISGAIPLTAGYTAATNAFDGGAILLFLAMAAWQMPHFYAIGIYRKKDYAKAGLPVWPVKRNLRSTWRQMLLFTVLFLICLVLLNLSGYIGYISTVIVLAVSLYWLWLMARRPPNAKQAAWGRRIFKFSLIVMLVFSLCLAINGFAKI